MIFNYITSVPEFGVAVGTNHPVHDTFVVVDGEFPPMRYVGMKPLGFDVPRHMYPPLPEVYPFFIFDEEDEEEDEEGEGWKADC